MLYGFWFLKVYGTESNAAKVFQVDEKTYRKWSKIAIQCMARVSVIRWENRFRGWTHLIPSSYVDGIHCPVQEKNPNDPDDFSHKINSSCLTYEVATAIGSSNIVHVSGGVPAGAWPDIKLARSANGIVGKLLRNEMVAADKGYTENGNDGRILPSYEMPNYL
ncbi:hypothetical protein BCR33DRAFT_792205 [Rhizoclosmatium globosum]|uniref:DDE Tnp4 domain-containing protein n=1 Tax=Rhizoclosmatium globosum TaxID=329046 RepID=A0A1Y2B9B2_9FUNG|nr:hypothetical protein BCR33DRAFT_792205 [Rhizoclosmatium globosum]|eukprot:ORY31451.1 hypothetical protein BCR33DRAFT_792205 [Rhizoclosmatium globosum]